MWKDIGPEQKQIEKLLRHFCGHVQNQLLAALVRLAEDAPKFVQVDRVFAFRAESDFVSRTPLREIGQIGRFLAFVKEFVHWNFESASHLLERLDGRNSVSIFDAGDVAAEQSGPLLDMSLGEIFRFAEFAKPVAY